jgi:hypothetical protein
VAAAAVTPDRATSPAPSIRALVTITTVLLTSFAGLGGGGEAGGSAHSLARESILTHATSAPIVHALKENESPRVLQESSNVGQQKCRKCTQKESLESRSFLVYLLLHFRETLITSVTGLHYFLCNGIGRRLHPALQSWSLSIHPAKLGPSTSNNYNCSSNVFCQILQHNREPCVDRQVIHNLIKRSGQSTDLSFDTLVSVVHVEHFHGGCCSTFQ